MQRIEVLVEDRELVALMRPTEVGEYLNVRRVHIGGSRIVDLAARLDVLPQQASDLIYGRTPFGPKMMDRLNAIDPDYELVQLVGVIRKKKNEDPHGGL